MARATRDLRYVSARRASARLTERDPARPDVHFGDTVTLERDDGRRQTFRIGGEDEADPAPAIRLAPLDGFSGSWLCHLWMAPALQGVI